jgi:hypothetical protein
MLTPFATNSSVLADVLVTVPLMTMLTMKLHQFETVTHGDAGPS